MNRVINEKLEALRKHLTLGEAASPSTSYTEYLKSADAEFLGEVAKLLKKEMGTKVSLKVHKGTSTVFMQVEGVNLSDMEVSLTVALHTINWTDVKLNIWGEAGMKGHVEDERTLKSGLLTPKVAADSVMEFLK